MNKEQLTEQLKGIEQEIDYRLGIRSGIRQQLADLTCPFVVGDKVIDNEGNHKAVVIRIKWTSWSEGYEFFIKKIKKDGGLFANESKVWDPSKWSKCEDPKTCSACCAVYSATLDQCSKCGGTECD